MTLFNYALAALGATATGSATGGTTPGQMIDGSDATVNLFANQAGNQIVDLKAPQFITQLRLIGNMPTNPQIYYCDDGASWLWLAAPTGFSGSATVQVGGISARYWRATCSSNSNNRLYTFAVEGPVEVPPPPLGTLTTPIHAWLDGINQYFRPAVDDWLDENL